MSARTGQLSYARFFVESPLPKRFLDTAHDAILAHAMRPLSPNEPEDERSGWSVLGEPLDLTLPYERVILDGFINLGFRTDRWAIPSPLLKSKVREGEARHLEKSGRERLSRREKSEIKEVVVRELRKKLVPVVRVVDLSWSLEEGVVRFFSHAEKTTGAMVDLFAHTFGVELIPESPFTLGRRLGLSDDEAAAWAQIEMTDLTREAR